MSTDPGAVDDLYGLDPDEFTAARDRLVKQLKAEGDKEAAASVRALRKPAVSAWALNQVARDHPDDVAALLEAGAGVRRAHEQALAGGSGPDLRAATKKEQQAVAAVAGLAADALRDAGRDPGPAVLERMTGTLRAAAGGGEAADLLRRGRLTSDLSPAGFGLEGLLETGGEPAAGARPAAAAERLRALEREADEASQRAEAAAEAAEEADRRATLAEQAAADARRRASEAAREAARARDEAREAEARRRRAAND